MCSFVTKYLCQCWPQLTKLSRGHITVSPKSQSLHSIPSSMLPHTHLRHQLGSCLTCPNPKLQCHCHHVHANIMNPDPFTAMCMYTHTPWTLEPPPPHIHPCPGATVVCTLTSPWHQERSSMVTSHHRGEEECEYPSSFHHKENLHCCCRHLQPWLLRIPKVFTEVDLSRQGCLVSMPLCPPLYRNGITAPYPAGTLTLIHKWKSFPTEDIT